MCVCTHARACVYIVCMRIYLFACGGLPYSSPFEAGSLTESRAHWICLGWLVSVLHGSAHFCSLTARPGFNMGAGDRPMSTPPWSGLALVWCWRSNWGSHACTAGRNQLLFLDFVKVKAEKICQPLQREHQNLQEPGQQPKKYLTQVKVRSLYLMVLANSVSALT